MIDEFDAACVAALIFDREEPSYDHELEEFDDLLVEKFNIDLVSFSKLIEALLPFCASGKSPLTDTTYRGFAKDGAFVAKTKA